VYVKMRWKVWMWTWTWILEDVQPWSSNRSTQK